MRVAILAFPRVQLLDVAGPADVFAEAARQLGQPRAYQVQVIGTAAGVLKSSSGVRLAVDATVSAHRGPIDTLLVAGSPVIHEVTGDTALHTWLRRQSRTVRRYGSVCSGAFVLAAAGLLDGKRVATHWNSTARLAMAYPLACVEPDARRRVGRVRAHAGRGAASVPSRLGARRARPARARAGVLDRHPAQCPTRGRAVSHRRDRAKWTDAVLVFVRW